MLLILTGFRRCAGSHRTRRYIYCDEDSDDGDDEDDDTCNVTSCTLWGFGLDVALDLALLFCACRQICISITYYILPFHFLILISIFALHCYMCCTDRAYRKTSHRL